MKTDHSQLKDRITTAFADRSKLTQADYSRAVFETIDLLDNGQLRVASKEDGQWVTHAWVKEAILLYFGLAKMEKMEVGPFEFFDKIPLKKDLERFGIRVVPQEPLAMAASWSLAPFSCQAMSISVPE